MDGTAAELLARADALAAVSEEPGRLTRRFATEALGRAGELVAGWMEEAGLAVRRDAAGNVLGRLGEPEEPPLVLGSHLDTVPDAGRFDGPLGVLAGIAVAGRVQARGLAPSLEVAAFADEEGARFGVPYLGSAAYAGVFEPAWLELVDDDGVTVAEAVRAAGGDPDGLVDVPSPVLAGYLEAHIEQGPVLEAEDLPVGVVSAIAGQTRAQVTLEGRAAHAGTTPMRARRDALAAASEIVLAVERCALDAEGLVATVGMLDVEPGATNVVPGRARLSVDVRHAHDDELGRGVAAIRRAVDAIAVGSRRRARVGHAAGDAGGRDGLDAAPPARLGGLGARPRDPLAAERRGARRRRALPRLPGRDALRPVRRGDQPRPARVGRRGRRRGRPRRARAGGRARLTLGEHRRPQWEMMGALIGSSSTGGEG